MKGAFVDEFLVRQNFDQKSKLSSTLADKVKTFTSFWRGRRERRRAGEEKELNFGRLKSIRFQVQHAALKVAADLKATASAADPYWIWF